MSHTIVHGVLSLKEASRRVEIIPLSYCNEILNAEPAIIKQIGRNGNSHNNGGLQYPLKVWKDGKSIAENIKGQVWFNSSASRLDVVLSGVGLAYLLEGMVQMYIQSGELIEVLTDWCQPFDVYYFYYPNRQLSLPAFNLVTDVLRF